MYVNCPACNGFGGDYDNGFTKFIPCWLCWGFSLDVYDLIMAINLGLV